jgi:hypothetical protein
MESVESILIFFEKGKRAENDARNKIRESILEKIQDIPDTYKEDTVYGEKWKTLEKEWKSILETLKEKTNLPDYTRYEILMKGGRRFHYDAELLFYNEIESVGSRKIEFKYGGKSVKTIPQFLSLRANNEYFDIGYDEYYYDTHLQMYLDCDPELKDIPISKEEYLKYVKQIDYSKHILFQKLKERESMNKSFKNAVVNSSIKKYLETYSDTFQLEKFKEKLKETQGEKYYFIWSNGKFTYDAMDCSGEIKLGSIVKGNVLEVEGCDLVYRLLLRWRNHKGILNPALQISVRSK